MQVLVRIRENNDVYHAEHGVDGVLRETLFSGYVDGSWSVDVTHFMFAPKCSDSLNPVRFVTAPKEFDTSSKWILSVFASPDESVAGRCVHIKKGNKERWNESHAEVSLIVCDSRLTEEGLAELIRGLRGLLYQSRTILSRVCRLFSLGLGAYDDDQHSEARAIKRQLIGDRSSTSCALQKRFILDRIGTWRGQTHKGQNLLALFKPGFPGAHVPMKPTPLLALAHGWGRVIDMAAIDADTLVVACEVEQTDPPSHPRQRAIQEDEAEKAGSCIRATLKDQYKRIILMHVRSQCFYDSLYSSSTFCCQDADAVGFEGSGWTMYIKAPCIRAAAAIEAVYHLTSAFTTLPADESDGSDGEDTGYLKSPWRSLAWRIHENVHDPDMDLIQRMRQQRQEQAVATVKRHVQRNMAAIKARIWHPEGRLMRARYDIA